MPDTPDQRPLSIQEVAGRLGVDVKTARRAVRLGHIPSFQLGGRVMVPREAFERMLREGLVAASG